MLRHTLVLLVLAVVPCAQDLLFDFYVSGDSEARLLGEFRNSAVYSIRIGNGDRTVWITDGTTAGTELLTDHPVSASTFGVGTEEFFFFMAGDPVFGDEPHISDGTAAGTFTINVNPGPSGSSTAVKPAVMNGLVYFQAQQETGNRELHVTDGTVAGTTRLLDLEPGLGASRPASFGVYDLGAGPQLFFTAYTATTGHGLWQTDGTVAGTTLLGQFSGLSAPVEMAQLGNVLVFGMTHHLFGFEPWVTDGTPQGTQLLVETAPGSSYSYVYGFRTVGQRVFFNAFQNGFFELWSTDGTAADTGRHPGFPIPPRGSLWNVTEDMAVVLLQYQSVAELWRVSAPNYDPSPVFTFDPAGGANNLLGIPYRIGTDRLVFSIEDGLNGPELWSTNGWANGTFPVTNFQSTEPQGLHLARAGDRLVFRSEDSVFGRELYSVPLVDAGAWFAEPYGFGCAGSNGVVPTLKSFGEGRVSSAHPFGVQLADAAPNAVTFFLWSTEPAAVPVSLCTLWLGGSVFVETGVTDALGSLQVSITPSANLAGRRFDSQCVVLDPGGEVFGIASSTAGLEFVLGF